MKKVLILGAGLVAKPLVEYLLEKGFSVNIATSTREKADRLIGDHPAGSSLKWSMEDHKTLGRLVGENDLTVSLLPPGYHTDVARICIDHHRPLVTTSYVQPAMQSLDEEAKKAGIILLNEIGLDPGIDHMSAMKIIDHVHGQDGQVEEFYSICGALPAPEAVDNPMGYKFSWSPKGVILASRNSALYLKNGKRISVDPENLFRDRFSYFFPGVGGLEVYPNRDSISYIDIYGIPEARTIYRGTFRYRGWCETLDLMKSLNMLDDTSGDYSGMSYAQFMAGRIGSHTNTENLKEKLAGKAGLPVSPKALESLEWLGFFSDEEIPFANTSPFEIISARMMEKISLKGNERDMVVLQHIFLASYPGGQREVIKSGMVDFGTPASNTAVARTVAYPAAIAARMILEKKLNLTGVYRPVVPEIYDPVLEELKELGIEMKEEYGLPLSEMIG